ncbi:hypothetical protein [Paraburkholderia sp. BCC1885]|uniref:hypothetical protein n=1 Tax=Paraburkholderia sp. BCC1885 TaxID=2562669 RepID=UPI001182ABCE|nr:hypothetical protein [Paraburkholderia sp. BCC1885]
MFTRRSGTGLTDREELVELIDLARGQFAHASWSFADLGAIFDAIEAATASGSLASRLAHLGSNVCEDRDNEFDRWRSEYGKHVEHFCAVPRAAKGRRRDRDKNR